jgi:hypothetical protein
MESKKNNKRKVIRIIAVLVCILFGFTFLFMLVSASILNVVHSGIIICLIVSFVLLFGTPPIRIFGMIFRRFRQRSKLYRFLLLVFLCCWVEFTLISFAASFVLDGKARGEIKSALKNVEVDEIVLRIDGKIVDPKCKDKFIKGFKKLRFINNKGGRKFKIECELSVGAKVIEFELCRNSINRDSFVIYYPKYRHTGMNIIGGFYTDSACIQEMFPLSPHEIRE